MEKTVWSGLLRGTHIFIRHWSSPFWCLDSKVTACFIVTYTCSWDSSGHLVTPPGNAHRSREAGHPGWTAVCTLPPPPYPWLTHTIRSFTHEKRMDRSCVSIIMHQKPCLGALFTDTETEAGRSLMRYPADLETGRTSWANQSLLFGEKLVNLFLMRCEFHDSWIHKFCKRKALTMFRSQTSWEGEVEDVNILRRFARKCLHGRQGR